MFIVQCRGESYLRYCHWLSEICRLQWDMGFSRSQSNEYIPGTGLIWDQVLPVFAATPDSGGLHRVLSLAAEVVASLQVSYEVVWCQACSLKSWFNTHNSQKKDPSLLWHNVKHNTWLENWLSQWEPHKGWIHHYQKHSFSQRHTTTVKGHGSKV